MSNLTPEEAMARIETYLQKHGFKITYTVDFPIYKILPDEVQLALSVLNKHGMSVSLEIKPIQEKK